jgi:hypothetical protein
MPPELALETPPELALEMTTELTTDWHAVADRRWLAGRASRNR